MAKIVLAGDEQRPANHTLIAPVPRTTIAALASGRLPCAIAVVRVSGPRAFAAARALAGSLPPMRTAGLRALRRPSDGVLLDRALVLGFSSPGSATGEDVVELHLHGSAAIVSAVLDALLAEPGVRLAEPGEFTRRAFVNGKLDITQAEGLADLLAATTEAQRVQATAIVEGALADRVATWRKVLIGALAEIDAELDFPDEVEDGEERDSRPALQTTLDDMRNLLARASDGERMREGVRVVLIGPPNVGKSSLMNALAGRDVAIVAVSPGTTRDSIEVALELGGVPVTLIDTAGMRDSENPVEAEGVRRAIEQQRRADLVLNVTDQPDAPAAVGTVRTKIDLSGEQQGVRGGVAYVSAKNGDGIAELGGWLAGCVAAITGDGEPALVTHRRQREAITRTADELERACAEAEVVGRAEQLHRALRVLGQIAGEVDHDEILDEVFARFCIGK